MILSMEELLQTIDNHFLEEYKLEYCRAFAKTGKHANGKDTGQQLEDWFRGELIYLFSILQQHERILSWRSAEKKERIGKGGKDGRPDFTLHIDSAQPIYFELKAMYLGWQSKGNEPVRPSIYFDEGSTNPQYLGADVPKLAQLLKQTQNAQCICLVFVYPSPENLKLKEGTHWDWRRTVSAFCKKMEKRGILVEETTSAKNYPQDMYIARLKVTRTTGASVSDEQTS